MPQQTSSYMFLHLSDFDKNSKGKHIMAFDVLILLDGNVTYSRHHYKSTCQSEQNQYELCVQLYIHVCTCVYKIRMFDQVTTHRVHIRLWGWLRSSATPIVLTPHSDSPDA